MFFYMILILFLFLKNDDHFKKILPVQLLHKTYSNIYRFKQMDFF